MQPFPYQIEGATFLAERTRALLADDMGLGKSAQAILACEALDAKNVLVICPASVRENWRREFGKFSATGIEPIVQSYNNANAINTDPPPGEQWDALILDEAHYLKTKTSKRTQAIFGPKCDGVGGLVERAKHVFLLSGTPAPNHAAELWPMLRACAPEVIATATGRPMPYWTFVSRFCKTRDNGFGIQIVGGKNLEQLRERMKPFVLRRKKDEVLKDLPPIRFDELPLDGYKLTIPPDLFEQQKKIEDALRDGGVYSLKDLAPHVAQLRRLTGLAKVAPCVEWIKDQLGSGLEKLVVFAHHRSVVEALRVGLKDYYVARIDGATIDRQAEVDFFQNDKGCRVFIGQITAAGTGITLTAASDALFVESSWVPADNEQAAMRIHRIGQKNACLVRFAALAGSIDEQIQRAVMRKTADIAKLFA